MFVARSKLYSYRIFGIIFLHTVLLILLLSGCTSIPKPEHEQQRQERLPKEADTATLNLAYEEDSLLYLPLYVAIHNQCFAKENLQINLQKYTSTKEAVEGLFSGKYDFLLHGPELGFYLYQQGQKNKLSFLAPCTVNNGWALLSRKTEASSPSSPSKQPISPTPPKQNTPSFNWNDTKGKVILGTKIGDFPEIVLEDLLRKNQLRPQIDVHLINNLPPPLRLGTFQSGTANFFLSTEPNTTLLENEGSYQVEAFFHEYTEPLLTSVISIAREKITAEPENYQKFLNAFAQALIWIENHSPEELTAVGKNFFPIHDEKTLIRGIARYKNIGCWPKSPVIEQTALKKLHDFLLNAGEINAALPSSDLTNLSEHPFSPQVTQ